MHIWGTPFNNSQTSGKGYYPVRASRASFLFIEGCPRLESCEGGQVCS